MVDKKRLTWIKFIGTPDLRYIWQLKQINALVSVSLMFCTSEDSKRDFMQLALRLLAFFMTIYGKLWLYLPKDKVLHLFILVALSSRLFGRLIYPLSHERDDEDARLVGKKR